MLPSISKRRSRGAGGRSGQSEPRAVYLLCHYPARQRGLVMPRVTQKQTQPSSINDRAEIVYPTGYNSMPPRYKKHDPKP